MSSKSVSAVIVLFVVLTMISGCSSKPTEAEKSNSEQTDRVVATNIGLATAYMQRNQLTIALEKAEKALQTDPKNSSANNMMAILRWRLKQYDKAEKYFRRAIKLDHINSSALNNYGAFLCDRGKIDQSLQYFDRSAENPLYQKPSQALTNAGRCLIKKPDDKKAEAYFRRALKFNRNESEALLQLAKLSYKSNRLLTARGFMQRFQSVGGNSAESLYLALRIENAMGNKRSAIKFARQLQQQFPTSDEASRVKLK